jgi:NAD(P)-dependent dehydrogenase (short-subunit alcohol dehydrogenase family)
MANMNGKIALITGSTDGVGRWVARRLAADGAHVIVHGRNVVRGNQLVDEIRKSRGVATFHAADLSTLEGMHELAGYPQLDILVNNAGIGVGARGSERQMTVDGIELRFALNYLAGFVLTHSLLPLLRLGHAARVVNVASVGQQAIDFDDVMLRRQYSGSRAYCQSKLAQIMFTLDLAEELKATNITTASIHPASYMDTTMVRNDGISPMSTVEEGGEAILRLLSSSEISRNNGQYFDGTRLSKAHSSAYDKTARDRLRKLSFELAKFAEFSK